MVKKISGKSTRPSSTTAVQPTRTVGASKVKDVSEVDAATKKEKASRIRRSTRQMTTEEKEQLYKLVHEEAGKLFGKKGLPEEKRETVESAVKMAIDASVVDEEDEEQES